jgi:hypothetical protein
MTLEDLAQALRGEVERQDAVREAPDEEFHRVRELRMASKRSDDAAKLMVLEYELHRVSAEAVKASSALVDAMGSLLRHLH